MQDNISNNASSNLALEDRKYIDKMFSAVMITDGDFNITYVNQSTLKLLGQHEHQFKKIWPSFSASERFLIGTCIDSFHQHPEHQRQLLADPRNLPFKTDIRVGDLTIELKVVGLFDEHNKPDAYTLEWSDVTEERREAAEISGQLKAISISQAVIEFDTKGIVLTANENFLSAIGYRLDEIQGQHHRMFVEPSFASSAEYKLFWNNLSQGKFEAGEYKRNGKGGKEIWIQASYNPILNERNEVVKVVKYATDVTEQKLRNAYFMGQIEAINKSQAVIEFTMDGTIVDANENFLTTMGYQKSDIVGKHHRMFVEDQERNSPDYQIFWEKLNRGEFHGGEFKRIGKNDRQVWIQATYNPISDLSGHPIKVVKYATDITGRKNAISEIQNALSELADGNLMISIDHPLEGELNDLRNSTNGFVERLRQLVQGISEASENVLNVAREIAQGNDDLSQRTESQASSLEETASAMEELTSTVLANAKSAAEATEQANGVMSKASNGGAVVKSAVSAMDEITKSSKKISDIIGVIDEIAFQTNLLALNAAVEAARAGEQGRGFAVVAAEVRNLAQRSASAAKEIKGLINDSVDAVTKGTGLVDDSGHTFDELVGSVREVVSMVSNIDEASREQSAGITEVSKAVSQMDEMTQQNAALVEEASASSRSMEDQAQSLMQQISFFRIGERSNVPVASGAANMQAPVASRRVAATRKPALRPISSDDEWEEF